MAGFRKATKSAAKLRLALAGPAGSGKTYSALAVATSLVGRGRVAVVDTEHGSASKYADLFDFDTLELQTFHPQKFVDAIADAEQAGYEAIILDSLSHAWMGKEGTLDLVDRAAKRTQSGNSFTAWKDVTPIQNALIERILSASLHVIATLRVKTEYVIVENDRGKKEPKKVGLQPIQRDQVEYEFDVYGDLDQNNNLIIGKTRCSALAGQVIAKPGKQLATMLLEWLGGTAPATTNGHVPLRYQEGDRIYRCEECSASILTTRGEPITAQQADILRQQFGRVVCREHRQVNVAAHAAEYDRIYGAEDGATFHDLPDSAADPPPPAAQPETRAEAEPPPVSARRPPSRADLWSENRRLTSKAVDLGIQGVPTVANRSGDDVLVQANEELADRIRKHEAELVASQPEETLL